MSSAREEEKRILQRLCSSKKAEFLAVYGRCDKKYLISQCLEDGSLFFGIKGFPNVPLSRHLANFHRQFCALFKKEDGKPEPKDWSKFLYRLQITLRECSSTSKVVIFFEETHWLAYRGSKFLIALDYFWNRHASRIPNVLLIVSVSDASWMIDNLINNKGGLYGRLSAHIFLKPLESTEIKKYLSLTS